MTMQFYFLGGLQMQIFEKVKFDQVILLNVTQVSQELEN